jgi:hypothetical protein
MATAAASIASTPAKKAAKQLPAPNSDFYQLADVLTAEEKATVKKVRSYMETKVQPIINKYWSDDAFPFELLPSFKELNLGGLGFEGYGCAGGSQKLFGFVAMELARVDASIGTFFGVHSGLAMGSIYLDGSEEQKQKWLPPMARFEKIGCFGLPGGGQDQARNLREVRPRRMAVEMPAVCGGCRGRATLGGARAAAIRFRSHAAVAGDCQWMNSSSSIRASSFASN